MRSTMRSTHVSVPTPRGALCALLSLGVVLGIMLGGCAPSVTAATARSAQPLATRLATATATTAAPTATVDGVPHYPTLAFLGDSLTRGYGASTTDHTYTAVLAAALHAHDAQSGVAVAGTSTSVYGQHVSDALSALQESGPLHGALITIELGTNDFSGYRASGPWQPTSIADFSASYSSILATLRHENPTSLLVCLSIWQGTGAVNVAGLHTEDYNAAIQHACASTAIAPARYVSIQAAYDDAADHGPAGRATFDGPGETFHPNDRGYAQIAAAIETAVLGAPVP